MIKDHQSVLGQATALVAMLKVTPKDNAVSKKLMADAEKTRKMFASKSGKVFERAYINNEVAYHKAVISTLEGVLIPESQNQELKQLLQSVMPAFKAPLDHAQMVQKNLNQVSSRAGMLSYSNLTKDATRDRIYLERRLELSFEGVRWLDLRSTGQAYSVMQKFAMLPHMTVFPIPLSQIQLINNPTIFPQNEGYN